MFGGIVVTSEQLETVSDELKSLSLQVEDDLFIVSTIIGAGDHFNYSCYPNVGLDGQIGLIAMVDIEVGDEVTFDEFIYMCGAVECREHITGNDWQLLDLQNRYDGYFSTYLQRRVEQIRE